MHLRQICGFSLRIISEKQRWQAHRSDASRKEHRPCTDIHHMFRTDRPISRLSVALVEDCGRRAHAHIWLKLYFCVHIALKNFICITYHTKTIYFTFFILVMWIQPFICSCRSDIYPILGHATWMRMVRSESMWLFAYTQPLPEWCHHQPAPAAWQNHHHHCQSIGMQETTELWGSSVKASSHTADRRGKIPCKHLLQVITFFWFEKHKWSRNLFFCRWWCRWLVKNVSMCAFLLDITECGL